ncbi:DUF1931 domain-containing protein [Candidatus Woesearchaeota archaeon]|nr:DUF1931 domain-containing protein [Candidatus Woesearchaeota archaeon]
MIVVKAKIKQYAKLGDKSLRVSEDFADALDEKVKEMVSNACARALKNSRTTIMPRDI